MNNIKLDPEWKLLILHALEIGITPDEIREFFKKHKIKYK